MLNKIRGAYFSRKSKVKRKVGLFKKKATATRNAVAPIWFPKPQTQRPKIDPVKRVERFFAYCADLEVHPYFFAHKGSGTISIQSSFDMENEDTASVNVDDVHLESFLTRMRQFLFENELYYFEDLIDSVKEAFDGDSQFEVFGDRLKVVNERPFPKSNVQVFLPNGEDAIAGRTVSELIEMELYTGRIHSEHTANPDSPYFPVADANVAVRKTVTFHLAVSSRKIAGNIFALRNHILRLARVGSKVELFPALAEFNERSKAAGF